MGTRHGNVMRTMMLHITMATALLFMAGIPLCQACPRECVCYHSDTQVECNSGLTSIPDGIPVGVKFLDLEHNKIIELKPKFDHLTKLTFLQCGDNKIQTIAKNTFKRLNGLKKLYMEYNKLTSLKDETFDGLTSLEDLRLGENLISTVSSNVFRKMTKLKLLVLQYNKITTLPVNVFTSQTALQKLWLSGNRLPSVSNSTMFCTLRNLTHLIIDTGIGCVNIVSGRSTVPLCTGVNTCNKTSIDECAAENYNCDQNAECLDTVSSYICRCKEGFSGNGKTCSVAQCADPGTPANGVRKGTSFRVGDSVSYQCTSSYVLSGVAELNCLPSASWHSQRPTCVQSNPGHKGDDGTNGVKGEKGIKGFSGVAGIPGALGEPGENGSNGEKGFPGDAGDEGFKGVKGDEGPRACDDPGTPLNGVRIGSTFRAGDTVRFQCNENYKLNGAAGIYCLAFGQWNSQRPTCNAGVE